MSLRQSAPVAPWQPSLSKLSRFSLLQRRKRIHHSGGDGGEKVVGGERRINGLNRERQDRLRPEIRIRYDECGLDQELSSGNRRR